MGFCHVSSPFRWRRPVKCMARRRSADMRRSRQNNKCALIPVLWRHVRISMSVVSSLESAVTKHHETRMLQISGGKEIPRKTMSKAYQDSVHMSIQNRKIMSKNIENHDGDRRRRFYRNFNIDQNRKGRAMIIFMVRPFSLMRRFLTIRRWNRLYVSRQDSSSCAASCSPRGQAPY